MIQFFVRAVFLFGVALSMQFSVANTTPTGLIDADIQSGKQVFQQCVGCHTNKSGEGVRVGPNLWGVVDREIGKADGFNYSDAFKTLEGQWNYETLADFLRNPSQFAPGTRMVIAGIQDDKQRRDLIAYLYTLSDDSDIPVKGSSTSVSSQESDPFGNDWPKGEGRDIAGYACSVCHSLAIVKQQGLSYDNWDELIEWMVDEQGMDPLPEDKLKSVLGYLSTHFNESRK